MSQAPSKTKVNHQTQGSSLQVIWNGLPQKPIDKAVGSFSKQLKMHESWKWTFRTLEVNASA